MLSYFSADRSVTRQSHPILQCDGFQTRLFRGVKHPWLLEAAVDDKAFVKDQKLESGNVRFTHLADTIESVFGSRTTRIDMSTEKQRVLERPCSPS